MFDISLKSYQRLIKSESIILNITFINMTGLFLSFFKTFFLCVLKIVK